MTEPIGRIVVLARDSPSGRTVVNALHQAFGDVSAIVEDGPAAPRLVLQRARRMGPLAVLGQVLFLTLVVPVLRRTGRRRVDELVERHGLHPGRFQVPVRRVRSVNDEQTIELLRTERPVVVVVSGTRILAERTLAAVDVPWLNLHAGITPAYRGGHGAYWALVDGRPDLVGSTVHLVDAGIDSGPIIDQVHFDVMHTDCFTTYPWLHLAFGIPLLVRAVRAALDGTLAPMLEPPQLPSRMRTHPTIRGYLSARIRRGVR